MVLGASLKYKKIQLQINSTIYLLRRLGLSLKNHLLALSSEVFEQNPKIEVFGEHHLHTRQAEGE